MNRSLFVASLVVAGAGCGGPSRSSPAASAPTSTPPRAAGGATRPGPAASSSASLPANVPASPPPRRTKLAHVASGAGATWVVRPDGTVWAWGTYPDPKGGSTVTVSAPARVDALHDVVQIAAGYADVFARLRDGTVLAWGNTFAGALGRGDISYTNMLPIEAMRGVVDAVDVQYEGSWGCVRTGGGDVSCWGVPILDQHRTPERVPSLGTVQAFSVGGVSACGIRANLTVACWGLVHGREFAGYGYEYTDQSRRSPDDSLRNFAYERDVQGAVRIAAADDHACAVTTAGKVLCWGAAAWGQLGYGKRGSGPANAEFVPVAAIGIDDARDVVVGGSATCAVRAGGTVACWGHNQDGQLGVGGGEPFRLEPVVVAGLSGVERIVKWDGGADFCAVRDDDSVWCWGGAAGKVPARVTAFDAVPAPAE